MFAAIPFRHFPARPARRAPGPFREAYQLAKERHHANAHTPARRFAVWLFNLPFLGVAAFVCAWIFREILRGIFRPRK